MPQGCRIRPALEGDAEPTPYADRVMEGVFDRRIRAIFDRLCAGAWSDVEMVVIPRTSEQEHKLYAAGDLPVRIGIPFADLCAPLFGVIGLLAALHPSQRIRGIDLTDRIYRFAGLNSSDVRSDEGI